MKTVKEVYFAGYAAFEKGRFQEAARIAQECSRVAEPGSYWHFGALGLCCWISNFIGDQAGVERYAHSLLEAGSGAHKAWFDAVAWFNLGLTQKRDKLLDEAKVSFDNASRNYASFLKQQDQPTEWSYIVRLFISTAAFASSGETKFFADLLYELLRSEETSEAIKHVIHAVKLYLRLAGGEDVTHEAAKAVHDGASRTFLAYILLAR